MITARRPVVAIQGLGFVGAAMSIAVASALDDLGEPVFDVIGVDREDPAGQQRIDALNEGRFPFPTSDRQLQRKLVEARRRGNLAACADPTAYSEADVVVIDVPLDIDWRAEPPELQLEGFTAAVRTVGRHVGAGTLILVETTVPPGTTELVVVPTLVDELRSRGLPADSLLVAHSYERVMPGAEYLDSIVNYWRVYAGRTDEAAKVAEEFLSKVINVADYPLTRLSNTTASETAKVLENTFRATTIALMDEWGRFAETVGVDLIEVVDAVRMRPTHANVRTPGFGVGGYCLTKDPLFARLASEVLFDNPLEFPFSTAAVRVNDQAPVRALDRLEQLMGEPVTGRHILLLGVSYRQDVGDTRYSPSTTFVQAAVARGARVSAHDPLVDHWDELDRSVEQVIPHLDDVDAIVLAVPHDDYRSLDVANWLGQNRPVILDAFDVWTDVQRMTATALGCTVGSIGRGATP